MSILSNYIKDIDEIKDSIKDKAEEILEVIDIDALFKMSEKEIKHYITEILYDYWESKGPELKKAIKLGENKAKKLVKAVKNVD